mmetsp:Transcript_42375/g.107686  ORF Transcript_42375/g.107686 Transcript_42375/m.107686 type:complete len:226 (-) Transcript_42375:367-1044(-)
MPRPPCCLRPSRLAAAAASAGGLSPEDRSIRRRRMKHLRGAPRPACWACRSRRCQHSGCCRSQRCSSSHGWPACRWSTRGRSLAGHSRRRRGRRHGRCQRLAGRPHSHRRSRRHCCTRRHCGRRGNRARRPLAQGAHRRPSRHRPGMGPRAHPCLHTALGPGSPLGRLCQPALDPPRSPCRGRHVPVPAAAWAPRSIDRPRARLCLAGRCRPFGRRQGLERPSSS